jgi:hypothetical protein
MVLPEDEKKIFNESLGTQLEDTNQQIKKWLTRWKPVIDHSMKRVKELAQANSKPFWQHFTANKPAKTNKSIKKTINKKTIKNNKNDEQPINKRIYKNAQEKVIEQGNKGNDKKI